jgi:hypothetical protein
MKTHGAGGTGWCAAMTGNEHVGRVGAAPLSAIARRAGLERGSDKLRQRTVAIHGMLGILRFPPGAVGAAQRPAQSDNRGSN